MDSACWRPISTPEMPLIFLCEDNGVGGESPPAAGWRRISRTAPRCTISSATGWTPTTACAAARKRSPMRAAAASPCSCTWLVRLMGHAGADVEASYSALEAIEANEAQEYPAAQRAHVCNMAG